MIFRIHPRGAHQEFGGLVLQLLMHANINKVSADQQAPGRAPFKHAVGSLLSIRTVRARGPQTKDARTSQVSAQCHNRTFKCVVEVLPARQHHPHLSLQDCQFGFCRHTRQHACYSGVNICVCLRWVSVSSSNGKGLRRACSQQSGVRYNYGGRRGSTHCSLLGRAAEHLFHAFSAPCTSSSALIIQPLTRSAAG